MKNILILFAHPRLEKSRANRLLLKCIPKNPQIYVHDLYEHYPDFNINLEREKELLEAHDIIVMHHPFYWYSCPPLLKQWIDVSLELGWAYGPGGTALKGKILFNTITTGGAREAYSRTGSNHFTIRELLAPFEQTARLCKMEYLPPFVVQATHRINDAQLAAHSRQYATLLQGLSNDTIHIQAATRVEFLNELIPLE